MLTLGYAILLVQVALVARGRFGDSRYFCWAPYDAKYEYTIEARWDGNPMEPGEILARYKLLATGVDSRAAAHLVAAIRVVESRLDPRADMSVELSWRRNGGPEERWTWPEG